MPFQAVPNTVEVDVRGLLFGQLVENTLYVRKDSAVTGEDLVSIAGIVDTWVMDHLLHGLSEDYTYRGVHVRDLSVDGGLEIDDVTHAGSPGLVAQPALPGGSSFAVSFRTGHAGRSYRGRNYVPGIPRSYVTGNTMDTTDADTYAAIYQALIDAFVSSDYTWVVVSRIADGVLRAVGLTNPVINAIVTDVLVDSMRRRLTDRGS